MEKFKPAAKMASQIHELLYLLFKLLKVGYFTNLDIIEYALYMYMNNQQRNDFNREIWVNVIIRLSLLFENLFYMKR